jgi:hypothetical protein
MYWNNVETYFINWLIKMSLGYVSINLITKHVACVKEIIIIHNAKIISIILIIYQYH